MFSHRKRITGTTLALLGVLIGGANAAPSSKVEVTDGWIRSMPAGIPAGGYFTLHNGTSQNLTLKGASSSACGMLMLHKSEEMSGMASMSDVALIDIPSGATVKFAPGGYHLMCMDPTSAVKTGNKISVSLEFADGSKTSAEFVVRAPNGH